MKCRDCKHWNTEYDATTLAGPGSVTSAIAGYGSCEIITDSQYKAPPALAYTAFGYDLFTAPDFGCKLFEAGKRPSEVT